MPTSKRSPVNTLPSANRRKPKLIESNAAVPHLRPGIHVGLCGWTVAQSRYVREFSLVEVQHTFYEPPSDELLQRWRSSAPARFEFTMKAWQVVTHESSSPTYRRLKQPLAPQARAELGGFRLSDTVLRGWDRTLQCARLLG